MVAVDSHVCLQRRALWPCMQVLRMLTVDCDARYNAEEAVAASGSAVVSTRAKKKKLPLGL